MKDTDPDQGEGQSNILLVLHLQNLLMMVGTEITGTTHPKEDHHTGVSLQEGFSLQGEKEDGQEDPRPELRLLTAMVTQEAAL